MKTTTLNKIRSHSPCESGYKKLLKFLDKTKADDEEIPFSLIVKSNGLVDALWCCRSAPEYDKDWRLFSVWCARRVQHLNSDPRVAEAIDTAEKFANGEATEEELRFSHASSLAAYSASVYNPYFATETYCAASSAYAAANYAAYAAAASAVSAVAADAAAAYDAAYAADSAAAYAADSAIATAAAYAADAAYATAAAYAAAAAIAAAAAADADADAAAAAANYAEQQAQTDEFLRIVNQ